MSYLFNNLSNSANNDAFNRMRVSEPFTLGDYKHVYGLDPNFIDFTLNGGTVTFQANQACARLTTSSNVNSRVVHQTKFYHHYMPGKSQLIFSTFNFYAATANVTKRTGYFDDNNGIFFEQTGNGTLNIVLRSYVSGVPVDTRIPQSQWNVDRCDGNGASNFNLLIEKTQLLFIDFQWLGVGRVRVGFSHNGQYIVAHEFNGDNNLTTVYMSNPNLPVRCEILNTGATTGGFYDQICSTVISEGGYVEAGQDWAITNPTLRSIAANATVPVLAIRLKSSFKTYLNRMIVRAGHISLISTDTNVKYRVIKLSGITNLTNGTWSDADTDSGVEYNSAATSFTGGDEIDNGWVAASNQGNNRAAGTPSSNIPSSAKKNYIVQNYDSTDSEIFVVVVTNLDATTPTNVGVGIQWREIY